MSLRPQTLIADVLVGTTIYEAVRDAGEKADQLGVTVEFEFNGQTLRVAPHSDSTAIIQEFHDEAERRHRAYMASPERVEAEKKFQQKAAQDKAALTAHLEGAPPRLTLRDPEGWLRGVANNMDGYGSAVYRFADQWARIMERRIGEGILLADCAKETSHIVSEVEGITGFQYGCAVGILAQFWEHGEELRRWHNLDTQIGDEGEKANESGGVLNPALLSIG